jgi:predicted nucleic acid-binding protein
VEWVDRLQGEIIGLDTAPIIYLIEEHPVYLAPMRYFFQAMERGRFRAITSTVTLIEVLVQPLRENNISLAEEYRDILLNASNLRTISMSEAVAEQAARLRAQYDIRTPDAIQLGTAVHEGASFFLTNDTRLPSVSNLNLLALDSLLKTGEG